MKHLLAEIWGIRCIWLILQIAHLKIDKKQTSKRTFREDSVHFRNSSLKLSSFWFMVNARKVAVKTLLITAYCLQLVIASSIYLERLYHHKTSAIVSISYLICVEHTVSKILHEINETKSASSVLRYISLNWSFMWNWINIGI